MRAAANRLIIQTLTGPSGRRQQLPDGRMTLIPSDYFDVWRSKGITTVVRLNDHDYERSAVTAAGFDHHDLFFPDCSTPSDALVDRFLRIAEDAPGAVAVHCLAGLGRTGTLIAMYLMKHLGFTADEAIAWLRIMRPGSVIGPQQQYLRDQEAYVHLLGRDGVAGMGLPMVDAHNPLASRPSHPDPCPTLPAVGAVARGPHCDDTASGRSLSSKPSCGGPLARAGASAAAESARAQLAEMVTRGMRCRELTRMRMMARGCGDGGAAGGGGPGAPAAAAAKLLPPSRQAPGPGSTRQASPIWMRSGGRVVFRSRLSPVMPDGH